MELKTINDFHAFFEKNGFQQSSYSIYEDFQKGAIVIIFSHQKFNIWRKKRKILKILQHNKTISLIIEIGISLGITPWGFSDF